MQSATSSTSSRPSIAWPTSGITERHISPVPSLQGGSLTRSTQITFFFFFLHSKFLWEGSQRVGVSSSQKTELEYSAFIRPDGSAVLIILNRYVKSVFLCLHAGNSCVLGLSVYLSVLREFLQIWPICPTGLGLDFGGQSSRSVWHYRTQFFWPFLNNSFVNYDYFLSQMSYIIKWCGYDSSCPEGQRSISL